MRCFSWCLLGRALLLAPRRRCCLSGWSSLLNLFDFLCLFFFFDFLSLISLLALSRSRFPRSYRFNCCLLCLYRLGLYRF
ncbi:hypothetical protein H206_05328 [Candidatus Electrothrix aarhusensis]|uniref:Uncharacterized protein n=1 Tax=Candidatus Electrothrix aarhusensis TaxID=1859131 RepID=A0A3S3R1V5_9BACT|nr:hypothetical protein H206_05328 [Candidatus Electrothrix aarhusensis]